MSEDPNAVETPDSIKNLRQAAEDGSKAKAELAEMRRELLFAKAGIDTDTKIGKMLYRTFEGDDLDALKTEATELGLIGGGTATPAPNEDELALQQARSGLRGGTPSGSTPPETVDPYADALTHFHDDLQKGARSEAAQLAAIDRVLVAAASGDKRVVFNQDEWDRMNGFAR